MFFKIGFFKNVALFPEKHLCWILFLISCRSAPKQVFSCEYCEIFKKSFFTEHLLPDCYCLTSTQYSVMMDSLSYQIKNLMRLGSKNVTQSLLFLIGSEIENLFKKVEIKFQIYECICFNSPVQNGRLPSWMDSFRPAVSTWNLPFWDDAGLHIKYLSFFQVDHSFYKLDVKFLFTRNKIRCVHCSWLP